MILTFPLEITQEDIDHGVRGDCRYCPVALALMRLFPETTTRAAGTGKGMVYGYYEEVTMRWAEDLRRWISDFDHHHGGTPTTFIIEAEWKEYA